MSVPVFQATVVNGTGDLLPAATITVLVEATGQPAVIYSDRNGTVPLGTLGVFSVDVDAFAQFFAAPGNYRVTANDSGSGFSRTWDYVVLTGTAATADIQTSSTDTTAGALMAVGAFGIASEATQTETDFNASPYNISGASVISALASSMTNAPPDKATAGRYAVSMTGGAIAGSQISVNRATGDIWSRSIINGAWSVSWEPVFSGTNYQPLDYEGIGHTLLCRNLSGGDISAGFTVDGSLLSVTKFTVAGAIDAAGLLSGGLIYRNMGRFVQDNDYTIFTRIS
tara:strand:- start:586 stop:1437 length:852 start_codon:yes stop_codon:yes gene_type:complete